MSNDTTKQFSKKELQILVGVGGLSAIVGFGITLAIARRSNPKLFYQSLQKNENLPDSGLLLAFKALGRATLYATAGFGFFCFASWKLLGVKNMDEFTAKVRSVMPEVPKKEPQGRSDFKTIREIVDYLLAEDEKKRKT